MKLVILLLALVGCTKADPNAGKFQLQSCGAFSGCTVEKTFDNQWQCEEAKKSSGHSIFYYDCVKI